MNTQLISNDQIRALQATRRSAGIDDDTWRDRIARMGCVSTRELTSSQAGALLDELNNRRLQGPYAAKARALWISGWQLCVIDNRSDDAMLAFVQRQTGIQSMSWLRDAKDGQRVIEALKGWLEREANVFWADTRNPKRAVMLAMFNKLDEAGAVVWQPGLTRLEHISAWGVSIGLPATEWSDADWDKALVAAGRMLRKVRADQAKAG